MDNYEAIRRMNREQMETFLDNVYLTGLNTGTYAASLKNDSEEVKALLDEAPYDTEWLSGEAEKTTISVFAEDGDIYLPNALCKAILRVTVIDPSSDE